MLGMNQKNAALAAGYSNSMAGKHTIDIEKRVKASLSDAFEQAGLTDKVIVEHALLGLGATKLCGELLAEAPDWAARHKYLELISKMTDRLQDKLKVSGIPAAQVNVYPTKVVVFKDINESDTGNNRSLHVAQGAESIGTQSEIQSS